MSEPGVSTEKDRIRARDRRRAGWLLTAAVTMVLLQVAARLFWPFWTDFFAGYWWFLVGCFYYLGRLSADG